MLYKHPIFYSPDGDGEGTLPPATDGKKEGGEQGPVPYARFKEVNDKYKALELRLAEIEAEGKSSAEKELAEQKKFQELADKRAADLAEANLKVLRLEVAIEKSLPLTIATRLVGKNKEEMIADAEQFAGLLKPSTPGVPPAPTRQEPPAMFTPEQMNDPEWVLKNEKAILEAARQGKIA
jgi:hypothetical protein